MITQGCCGIFTARGASERPWLLPLAGVVAACAVLSIAACGRTGGGGGGGAGSADARALPVERVIGRLGTAPGEFAIPRAITADDHFVYVVDKAARIQAFEPATGRVVAWWKTPEWELGKPTGMTVALAPRDTLGVTPGQRVLYVADTHYHRVLVYPLVHPATRPEPQSTALAQPQPLFNQPLAPLDPPIIARWGAYGEGAGEFIYVTSVAVVPDEKGEWAGRIYVSEYGGNDRVSAFDGSLNYLFSFGRPGSTSDAAALAAAREIGDTPNVVQRPGLGGVGGGRAGGAGKPALPPPGSETWPVVEFERPQQVVYHAKAGELLIADSRNHRIGRFTLEGKLLAWFGSPETSGKKPGQWRYPWGLAILDDNTALVIEHGNNRVQRIDVSTGACLGTWGKPGRQVGDLAEPWAVAMVDGLAYIVDTGNHRVEVARLP